MANRVTHLTSQYPARDHRAPVKRVICGHGQICATNGWSLWLIFLILTYCRYSRFTCRPPIGRVSRGGSAGRRCPSGLHHPSSSSSSRENTVPGQPVRWRSNRSSTGSRRIYRPLRRIQWPSAFGAAMSGFGPAAPCPRRRSRVMRLSSRFTRIKRFNKRLKPLSTARTKLNRRIAALYPFPAAYGDRGRLFTRATHTNPLSGFLVPARRRSHRRHEPILQLGVESAREIRVPFLKICPPYYGHILC